MAHETLLKCLTKEMADSGSSCRPVTTAASIKKRRQSDNGLDVGSAVNSDRTDRAFHPEQTPDKGRAAEQTPACNADGFKWLPKAAFRRVGPETTFSAGIPGEAQDSKGETTVSPARGFK